MTHLVVVSGPSAVTARDLFLGIQWCDEVTVVAEPGRYADTLRGLFEDARLIDLADIEDVGAADGVVTFTEGLIAVTAELGRRLGVAAHGPDTVLALQDKTVQRACLAAAGLGHVLSHRVETVDGWADAVREVGLPLVLKPARGEGSSHTRLATTPFDVDVAARAWFASGAAGPLIAETFLVGEARGPYGDYVSVESLCADGAVRHLGVTGKLPMLPPFRETAQFHPSGLQPALEAEVQALTDAALRALGVRTAATHTEIKLTTDGPRIIEVNGRLGGYLNELYSRALDTDVVELVTRQACGQAPALPAAACPGVHFQYTHQPPAGARRLLGLDGTRTVARDHAVCGYQRLVALGEELPDDGRTVDLDLLSGHATDHGDMLSHLARLRPVLEFTLEFDDGVRKLRGDQLG